MIINAATIVSRDTQRSIRYIFFETSLLMYQLY